MDKAPTITRSTPIHIDALNKRIERLKRDKADLRAEAHGLERALIAEAALVARERQAAAEAARTAELNRLQQMVEAQDALTRIKTQMESVKEAARAELTQQAEQSVSEQFVEQLRSEYEARLFAATSKAERALIEKEQAEAALARQEATLAAMRDELQERRDAMTRLHAACSRSCNVAAASAFASTLPDNMLMRLAQPAVDWTPPQPQQQTPQQPPPPPPPPQQPAAAGHLETPIRPAAYVPVEAAAPRTDIRPRAAPNTSATRIDEDDDDDGGGDNSGGGGSRRGGGGGGGVRFAGVEDGASSTTPRGSMSCSSGMKCGSGVSCAGSCAGCGSSCTPVESQRAAMEAEAELSMRLGLAKAEKALQAAAKRETAMSERHAVECERYESELRRAEARAVVSGASPDPPCLHHFGASVLHRAACSLSRRPFVPFTRLVPSAFPYASSSSSLPPFPFAPASAAPGAPEGDLTARDRARDPRRGLHRAAAHVGPPRRVGESCAGREGGRRD